MRVATIRFLGAALGAFLASAGSVHAGTIFLFSDPSGLSAEAEFTASGTTLTIRLKNTSTGAPGLFSNSDQILTGISWDFGQVGFNGDPTITGGSVAIGSSSASLNFDNIGAPPQLGPGADVSGEYGYGNMDGTGALTNFVSANTAAATPFGGANLDGPASIDGPQGGLVASPEVIGLGGLGAIQDEIDITLTLSEAVLQQDILGELGQVRVEFGSDAAFITVPEPGSLVCLCLGASILLGRRRRSS
jgi:hypothetical protein